MTEENKKKNIKAELEQAEEVFRGAVALKENGFFKDAVSRFYYAAFHTLRAANSFSSRARLFIVFISSAGNFL